MKKLITISLISLMILSILLVGCQTTGKAFYASKTKCEYYRFQCINMSDPGSCNAFRDSCESVLNSSEVTDIAQGINTQISTVNNDINGIKNNINSINNSVTQLKTAVQNISNNGVPICLANGTNCPAATVPGAGSIINTMIAANAITTDKIIDGAITNDKINSVNNNKISGLGSLATKSTITEGDISGTIQGSKITNPNFGNQNIVTTGTMTASGATINGQAVCLANGTNCLRGVTPGSVDTSDIVNDAVTTDKIAPNAVETSDIKDGAVTDAKITSGIANSKISGLGSLATKSTITEGDISGTIQGSKITNPNFGNQNIVTTGNVGIGTSTFEQNSKLEIQDNSLETKVIVKNLNGTTWLKLLANNGGNPYISYQSNNGRWWSIGLDTSDSEKFKISQSSGLGLNDIITATVEKNVGIGTTYPAEKLEVIGNIKTSGNITASGATINSQSVCLANGTNCPSATAPSDSITSEQISDGTIVNADINTNAAIAGTKILPNFGSQNITTTGNVGIGTNKIRGILTVSPGLSMNPPIDGWGCITNGGSCSCQSSADAYFLDIDSDYRIEEGECHLNEIVVRNDGTLIVGTSYFTDIGPSKFIVNGNSSLRGPTDFSSGGRSWFTYGDGYGVKLASRGNSKMIFLLNTNITTMTLSLNPAQTEGLVGIGTISPTEKLEVNGNVKITNVLRLTPRTRPTTASEGDIYADSTKKEPCYYTGTEWKGLISGTAC